METNTPNPPKAAADPTPLRPEAIVEQLRALRTQIPEFTQLQKPQSFGRTGRLNPDFTLMAINTVGDSPLIEQAVGRPAATLRDELDEANRWSEVEDELKQLLQGVAAANRLRRHRLGNASLLAYNLGLHLAKQKEHELLLPRVREMKRTPKFAQRRAKPGETPDAPQPPKKQP